MFSEELRRNSDRKRDDYFALGPVAGLSKSPWYNRVAHREWRRLIERYHLMRMGN